ncbi:MAG: Mrp/NBP35 family ATP-binding protein [Ruminococcaceae bacterium]|nr:Mrp/NBP35 family ATP-binding protein [Oscillospiraceae bacterium]
MSECTHDCSSCGENCSSRKDPQDLREKPHPLSKIKKIIAVVSGKGGVGKSMVTSMLAAQTNRNGKKTAILDADITGPSIPQVFGLSGQAYGDENGILPVKTGKGINVISLNLLIEHTTDPVIWRGPVIAGVVKQFWTDVIWGDVDYMFIDMPPGTGDVPLTVFQSIPVDGIIIVTSPQELVSMIVEKAVNMAKAMNIPILGIVENMSYFKCDQCGREHSIFGESHIEETAKRFGIDSVCRLPINPAIASMADRGQGDEMKEDAIVKFLEEVVGKL